MSQKLKLYGPPHACPPASRTVEPNNPKTPLRMIYLPYISQNLYSKKHWNWVVHSTHRVKTITKGLLTFECGYCQKKSALWPSFSLPSGVDLAKLFDASYVIPCATFGSDVILFHLRIKRVNLPLRNLGRCAKIGGDFHRTNAMMSTKRCPRIFFALPSKYSLIQ